MGRVARTFQPPGVMWRRARWSRHRRILLAALLASALLLTPFGSALNATAKPISSAADDGISHWTGKLTLGLTQDVEGCIQTKGSGSFTVPIAGEIDRSSGKAFADFNSGGHHLPNPTGSFSSTTNDCGPPPSTSHAHTTTYDPCGGTPDCDGTAADIGDSVFVAVEPDGTLHYVWRVFFDLDWASVLSSPSGSGPSHISFGSSSILPVSPIFTGTTAADATSITSFATWTAAGGITYDAKLSLTLKAACDAGAGDRVAAATTGSCGPKAIMNIPFSVPRAATVFLDGSDSTDTGGAITSWLWKFSPGPDCPSGTKLTNTSEKGKDTIITVLCSLKIRLKVKDDHGRTDTSNSTVVSVLPRTGSFSATQLTHRDDYSYTDPRTPTAPLVQPAVKLVIGRNVTDCSEKGDSSIVFCPYVKEGKTHNKHGFTVSRLADKGGPFDGFAYVSATELSLKRVGLYNPNLDKNAPPPGASQNWWAENSQHGVDLTGLMTALAQHEGLGGPGRPNTGHSSALELAANDSTGNANARLEPIFGRSGKKVTKKADKVVDAAQFYVYASALDLNVQDVGWSGQVWFFDQTKGTWTPNLERF